MRYPREKSEEGIQKCRENKKRLQELMEIITKRQKEKPEGEALEKQKPSQRRMFEHLSDDMLIKDIAIAPRVCSMPMLMTFMATEILEIYPWESAGRQGKSKVYVNDILKALSKGEGSGDSHKYNRFCYEKLEECFLPEENKKAAQRLFYLKKHDKESKESLLEKVGEEELEGFRLMEEIRNKVRKAMNEYWKYCGHAEKPQKDKKEEEAKESYQESKEEECKRKEKAKKLYEKCLMAAALHEIYLHEYYINWKKKEQKLLENMKKVQEMVDRISFLANEWGEKTRRPLDEDQAGIELPSKESVDEVEKIVSELNADTEMEGLVNDYVLHGFFVEEHLIGFYAEIQIIMQLETQNFRLDKRWDTKNTKWEKLIDLECFQYMVGDIDYNMDNKGKLYKQLNAYIKLLKTSIQDSFHRLEDMNTTNIDFSTAMEQYFLLGNDKNQQEEIPLRECIIGKPLMQIMNPAIFGEHME